MRSHPLVLSFAVAAAAVATFIAVFAGGGPSVPPPAPNVGLAISAPINGATVGVRRVMVAGTVTPHSAAVTVDGHPATVRDGSFVVPLQLAQPTQTITVIGRAGGYRPATSSTTISYSTLTAAQLAAGRKAAATAPPVGLGPVKPARSAAAAAYPINANKSPNTAFPLPGSGSGGTSSGGTSGNGGSGHSGTVNVTPVQPVVWTQAQIHDWYVRACAGAAQTTRTSFCQCTYRQLARSGAMRSRQSLVALVRALKPYDRTHNPASLPNYVHLAILDCAQYLPDNNVAASPVIHRLPTLSHPPAPAP